jgi:hypothetical protein
MTAQQAELCVLGTEIMPPVRHAVRLVDGDERDVDAGQPFQETAANQPLGTEVEQVEFTACNRASTRRACSDPS